MNKLILVPAAALLFAWVAHADFLPPPQHDHNGQPGTVMQPGQKAGQKAGQTSTQNPGQKAGQVTTKPGQKAGQTTAKPGQKM